MELPSLDMNNYISVDKETKQTTLSLLHPLSDPNMRAACRNPDSRYSHMSDGSRGCLTSHEVLDLAPLSKAWRNALTAKSPIQHIAFDLSFPSGNAEKSIPDRLYWDADSSPNQTDVLVHVDRQQVTRLMAALATVTRMRGTGAMRFEVVLDFGSLDSGLRIAPWVDKTRKHLTWLAEYRSPAKEVGEFDPSPTHSNLKSPNSAI